MVRPNWVAGVVAAILAASAVQAQEPAAAYHLSIGAAPLDAALNEFARQSGLQVIMQTEEVKGITAPKVEGTLTGNEALERLLGDSGLQFEFLNDRTVTVFSQKEGKTFRKVGAASANGQTWRLARADVAPGPSDEVQSDKPEVLEVTVFGRGMRESVRGVPQTVSVYDSKLIETTAATEIQDIVRFVPTATSTVPDLSVVAETMNLRGFGTSYVVNGIAGAFDNTTLELANVERVEVLMGPASVLYGSMEPGGVINVVTKAPQREFHLRGSAELGSFDRQRYSLDVGGPLSDRVRWRLNSAYSEEQSFITSWKQQRTVIAPSLSFDLAEATQLRIDGLYMSAEWPNGAYDGRVPARGTLLPNSFGEIPRSFSAVEPQFGGYERSKIDARAYLDHQFNDAWSANVSLVYANLGYDGPTYFLVGILPDERTGRRAVRFDDNPSNPERFAHVDLKGRLATGPLEHQLLLGADYLKETFDARESFFLINTIDLFNPVYGTTVLPNPLPVREYQRVLEASGAFAQDRIRLGERLHFTAGVRYSKVRNISTEQVPNGQPLRDELSSTNWSSQLGVVYEATESTSLFASRNESFVPRGGSSADGRPFDPEKGIQYELGARVGAGSLTGSLTLFEIEKPNVLAADPFNLGYLAPLGAVRSRGVELSTSANPLPGWTLYAAYAYLDAKVTKSTEATFDGTKLSNAPSSTLSLISSYDIQSGPLMGLGFSLAGQRVGQRYADSANILQLPSYTRIDVGAHYTVNDSVRLSLSASNVTDEDIYTGFLPAVVGRQFGRVFSADIKVSL